MNSSIYRFTLDMHSARSQISIPALIGDTARTLCIVLSDGGKPYVIEDGCLAKLTIKRPTGTVLEEFCKIENNTTIVYDFFQNENTAAVEGIHDCDITLYGLDGRRIATSKFTMVVSERAVTSDDIVLADKDLTAVDAMLAKEAERQFAETGRQDAEKARESKDLEREARIEEISAEVRNAITEAHMALEESENVRSEARNAITEAHMALEESENVRSEARNAIDETNNSVEKAKMYAEQAQRGNSYVVGENLYFSNASVIAETLII